MRTLPFGVFYAALTMQLTATGAEVAVGMAEADLLTAKGEPQATMMAGEKTIYRWSDMVVLLDHARVVSIDPRDLQKEQAEQKRRAQMLAEIARKAEIARQQAADAAKKQAAEEERLRPQRELDALKAKVEKLEQDKKAEAAAQQQQIDDLERARQSQIQNLRQAVDTSGYYYRKARDAGDKEKAASLLRVLLNQQAQLSALTGEPVH
ncbi:MAG: hypothetical protein WC661_12745 [Opitutaceae bacterium]|jgi:hypothetical protein